MRNYLLKLGQKAKKASTKPITSKKKDQVLEDYCKLIIKNQSQIINQNKKDVKEANKKKIAKNLIERLFLDKSKILQIIYSIKSIKHLKDPVNKVIEKWKRPNGLTISKVTIPFGVIGVIYESRPNVTSDVASLCFKSENPVILKGGSEAYFSNKILSSLFRKALQKNNIDKNYVQFVDIKNKKVVDFLLTKMGKYINVIIPRGGKSLVKKVQELSRVPIIGHLEGICHTYIDKDSNLKLAKKITLNAKLRNTAICGATETILFHKKILKKFCNIILSNLANNGCKIIGDNQIKKIYKGKLILANEKDWYKEYLSAKISVKTVNNVDEAINHINKYGTMHTDSILTQNQLTAKKFMNEIKSSIAMHNTSTQFADGGEFGFGGEVGISTNALPPRGPIGLKQLVSYKYQVTSKGKIRN
jgi:glutamate-5-semialdehyde dehydrogenase